MPLQLATAVTTLNQGPLQLRTGTRAESMRTPARPRPTARASTNLLADSDGDDEGRSMKDEEGRMRDI
jgi:hypothetical protein